MNSFGGSSDEEYNSVAELHDGSLVVVGYSSSSDAGFENKGESDAIIVKYNSQGKQIWYKALSGSASDTFCSSINVSK
jgi:hypothetical protein